MSSPALTLEATTIHVAEEIAVRASIEVTFAALLDQLGPYNETQADKPMPMKLEAWPGGRWYRDLGGNNGHYWGTVQAIKKPTLLEICGPLFMSNPVMTNLQYRLKESGGRNDHHISAPVVRSGAGGIQKRKKWLGTLAPAYAPASGSPAAPLTRERLRNPEEGNMCPTCIEGAAVMAAGAGSMGGILAVCIGKFRNFFRTNGGFVEMLGALWVFGRRGGACSARQRKNSHNFAHLPLRKSILAAPRYGGAHDVNSHERPQSAS
jgi:hypothetical protein